MPNYWYKECNPDNIEQGAVIYEDDVPVCRTCHLPGWVASDHDDLAQHLIVELFTASQRQPERKPIQYRPVKGNHVLAA